MESSQPARPDSSPVLSIQALRAIAALLVLWGHAINAVNLENLEVAADFPHLYGPFGVDLFFVISGFVMVYSSERLFGEPRASIKFFARRLARVVPLYWAATATLVWFVVPYASTKAVLGSLFFAPHVPSEAPLLFVGWTLIFEMFFYTIFAIALLAKRRIAVVASTSLALISFVALGPGSTAGNWAPPASSSIAYLADPVSIEFVFGMMIALLYRAGVQVPVWATVGLLVVACIWLTQSTDMPSVPRPFGPGIAATLIVAAMSLSSMSSPKYRPFIGGVTFLADVSYALYCTHLLSFSLVAWVTIKLAISPVGYAWAYFVAMLATGLVIAAGTHLLFEKPITNFLKRLIERPDGRANSAITKFRPSFRPSTI